MNLNLDFSNKFIKYWLNNQSIFDEFNLLSYLTKTDILQITERAKIYYNNNAHGRTAKKVVDCAFNGEAIHYLLTKKYPNLFFPELTDEYKYHDLNWFYDDELYSIEIKSYTEYLTNPDWTKKSFINILKNTDNASTYYKPDYAMVFSRPLSFGPSKIANVQDPRLIRYLLCFIFDYNKNKVVFYNQTTLEKHMLFNIFKEELDV